MVDLVNNNDVGASAPNIKFQDRKLSFNANEANRDNEAMAKVYLDYPYPPKDCAEALARVKQLQDVIKAQNESMAAGGNKNVGERWIGAYQTVLTMFNNYAIKNKCQEQIVKEAEAAYNAEWQGILNAEQKQTGATKTSDNLIVFGALGFLLLTTIVIIVRKSRR